jgi:Flp pilus assembly protein TadG
VTREPAGDEGSVLVLVVGLTAVLVVLVGVVVDVSAVVLARRSLSSAADGAAVAAAQALDDDAFYARGPAAGVPLSRAEVQDRVSAYEASTAQGQPGLRMRGTVDGGYTAVVTATRTVRLPFSGRLGVAAVEVGAVARARAPLVP